MSLVSLTCFDIPKLLSLTPRWVFLDIKELDFGTKKCISVYLEAWRLGKYFPGCFFGIKLQTARGPAWNVEA